ncbi:MAG: ABC transporter ATP-binding protein [Treponema sp.]|nr:ABC transporter ATP-binding protein [Treponema sp.]
MADMLDIKALTVCVKKEKKTFIILDNISFSIKEGEILGLAGESGCGKSITALSIPNLLPQNISVLKGEINYNNCNLVLLKEKELCGIRGNEIAVIFQDVRQSLNPMIRIGKQITESLELSQRLRKQKIDKENNKTAVTDILKTLGFNNPQKIFNAFPHQLSGGMCQRIVTAIAAIKRPKLLLADEPSSSLDEESQEKCLSLLKEMNQKHKTSLLVISHDLSIIRQFCSRYLIMYAGKIIEEGPSELLYTPLHPYTNALINAAPHKDKRGSNLKNIHGKVPSIEDRKDGCPFAPRCAKAQLKCIEEFPQAKEFKNRRVFCSFPELTGGNNE